MSKRIFVGLVFAVFMVPAGVAQNGSMDTCQGERACDTASDRIIAEAEQALGTGRHREAARIIYPAVLSRKTSPRAKARASNALSELLESAGLYEYAAVQKRNATEVTRAPASVDLLEHARLMAKGSAKKEMIMRAYSDVEDLAIEAANLSTIDALIADYTRMGERGRAAALRAQRADIRARADEACAQAGCTGRRVVSAKVQELGPIAYPREARRQVGECTVTLNVTETGKPVDLTSDCSDPVFVESAMIAVQQSQFSARYENGAPSPQYNVIMPFNFEPG